MFKVMVVFALLGADKLTFEKLPQPVRAAVQKAFGSAKVVGVDEEKEEGKVVYEVKVKQEGHIVELSVHADGTVVSEERAMKFEEAPSFVRNAITAAGGTVESVEQVTEGGVVTFEAVVRKADKSRVELVIGADGGVESKPATE